MTAFFDRKKNDYVATESGISMDMWFVFLWSSWDACSGLMVILCWADLRDDEVSKVMNRWFKSSFFSGSCVLGICFISIMRHREE